MKQKALRLKNHFLFATAASLFLVLAACAGNESQSGQIKIGIFVPLSGDTTSYGVGVRRGIEIAYAEWKLKGLTNVKLIYEDSRCEARSAVNAVNKLISVDQVSVLIGEVCSGGTLAAAPIAEKNHVPLVTPASTSPAISEAGDYIWRTIPSDALQGAFGAGLVIGKGFKKLAIIYPNEDYGVGFSKVLDKSFKEKGGAVVANEAFPRGSVDLRGQLTKIKNAKPDALYLISNSPDSALAALRQIKELGITAVLFASEGVKTPEVAVLPSAEGLILTSVSAGTSAFIDKHRELYHEEPGPFSAQAYDAFTAVAMAILKGSGDRASIQKNLPSIAFEGAGGKIAFDKNGDVTGTYDVLVVRKGKFEPVR